MANVGSVRSARTAFSKVIRRWSGLTTVAMDEMHQPYQVKLKNSLSTRIALIEGALPRHVKTVLDVGCNLGDVSAELAQRGYWVVGVDSSSDLIGQATARHSGVSRCAFMVDEITPESIGLLPEFDCALVLSVHHHWIMKYGHEVAGRMLGMLAKRTRYVLFYEGASRRQRYGPYPPDFVDNDEVTVTKFLESCLRTYCAESVAEVRALGPVACVGEREPYRWNYALYRNAAAVDDGD